MPHNKQCKEPDKVRPLFSYIDSIFLALKPARPHGKGSKRLSAVTHTSVSTSATMPLMCLYRLVRLF